VKLSDQSVVVDAPRELCFEVVAAAGQRRTPAARSAAGLARLASRVFNGS